MGLVLLGAAYGPLWQPKPNADGYRYAHGAARQPYIPTPPPYPGAGVREPLVYPNPCTEAANEKKEDSCSEFRAANAAESQALWAWWTFIVGIAGAAGVVGTLIYSAITAGDAWKTATLAEQALTDIERPHLFVAVTPQPVVEKMGLGIPFPFVEFSMSNFGRTPAEIIKLYASPSVDVKLRGRPPPFETGHRVVGQSRTLGRNRISLGGIPIKHESDDRGFPDLSQPILAAEAPLHTYFRVDIEYKGIGPTIYESEFAWRWDDNDVLWALVHSRRT